MALTIKEGKTFEPVAAGMHFGICTWLYDVGTQETDFQGKKKKQEHVIVSWELPDVRIDVDLNGTTFNLPRMFSKEFNASLNKRASLRKILEGWRGRPFSKEELQGFDLRNILNKCCLLQIIHQEKEDGGTKAVLQSVVPLMAGMTGKTPETEVRFFEFGTSTEIPEGTPEWILNRLKESEEWGQFGKTLSGDGDEPKKPAFMTEAVAPPDEVDDGNGNKPPF